MKQLSLTGVMIRNFRSFREEYVQLSTCDGLKLFSGQNQIEPRLGANGVGKTSFWDAVFWCFYGTSLKGLRTASLIQWHRKTAEVLVELDINGKPHTIYRAGPPARIEIDEKPATQLEVDKLIGLSGDQFTHSIVFGQGVPLFPDLPIPERGALLDSVLNLDIWQKASEAATKKVAQLDKQLNDKKLALSRIEGQLEQLPTEDILQIAIDLWNSDRAKEVKAVQESIDKWNYEHEVALTTLKKQSEDWVNAKVKDLENQASEIDLLEREIATTEDLIKLLTVIDTAQLERDLKADETLLRNQQRTHTELETKLKLLTKPLDFWLKNNNCPECKQPITDETKQQHLVEIEAKQQELTNSLTEVTDTMESVKGAIEEKKVALTTLQHLKVENNVREGQYRGIIKRAHAEIKRIEALTESSLKELESHGPYAKQIERVEKETNPHAIRLELLLKQENPHVLALASNKQVRDSLEQHKIALTDAVNQIEATSLAATYWKNGFKRIRLYFIHQILGALEIEIQSAISALGLEGWRVKLATETETKSGTTKLGVQIHIKSPISEGSWEVWSGGETQRLRLAIAMGLGSLIQRAAGSWFSFETWDEPSAWLSSEGIEDLLQALQYRAESQRKSIWLVDHRALQFAGFKEIWLVSKEAEGSSIQLLEAS